MTLSVIIVGTNERHVLAPCLRSLAGEARACGAEVVVVDNGSTDGTGEMLKSEFPFVRVVANAENRGFAAANNRGIAASSGEFVLLLNPDTIVKEGAFRASLRFMEEHPGAGIAGCKLLFPDGRLQRSVRSFPGVWNVFCETTFLYLLRRPAIFSRTTLPLFDYEREARVDWVCGAFLLIRRCVIEEIGALDEQFYMYTEEVDYCFRAARAGFEVWYFPNAEVVHVWGGVSAPSRRVIVWGHASQMLFFQKHFRGPGLWALVALRYAGIVLRVCVYFLAACVSLNPDWMKKARYSALAAYRLAATPLKYRRGWTGPVAPWAPV